MKITPKLCQLVLAFLSALTIGTAQAQTGAGGKVVSPASPAGAQSQEQVRPLPAKPVADKLAATGWTRYEIGEPARFSLLLPSEPMSTAERSTIIPGVRGITRTYMSIADSGVYGVSYLEELPAALQDESRKQTFFAGFVSEFARGFQASMKERGTTLNLKMLEQRPATGDGLAGYEQDFSYGMVMGRVRLVFDAGSAYAVTAIWNGLSSSGERDAFFKSLKVNPKR